MAALASALNEVCSDRVGEDAVAALASVLRDDRLAKTAGAIGACAVAEVRDARRAVAVIASAPRADRVTKTAVGIVACAVVEVCDDRVAKTAGAIVAFARDREVRVLAAPLVPAGRIRGDVIEDRQVELLGHRARSPHATTRMAFRVACSEHSTAALALTFRVVCSEHPTAALALTFRVACSEHSTAALALTFRVVWSAASSCARGSARGPRVFVHGLGHRVLVAVREDVAKCPAGPRGEARRALAVVRAGR